MSLSPFDPKRYAPFVPKCAEFVVPPELVPVYDELSVTVSKFVIAVNSLEPEGLNDEEA